LENGIARRLRAHGKRGFESFATGSQVHGLPNARMTSNIGPEKGPILSRDAPDGIGVLQARDNHMPIGIALGASWDEQGRQLWRLTVHKVEVPGLWVLIDREFVRAQETAS
jgi:hypothetical protein